MGGHDGSGTGFADRKTTCPQCRVPLEPGMSRVAICGTSVGAHGSLRCDFCGFFLLTAAGLGGALVAAREVGIAVRPEKAAPNRDARGAESAAPENGGTARTESA